MADTPIPTPPSFPGQPAEAASSATAEAIQTQINGVPSSHVTTRPAGSSQHPSSTFRDWAVYRLMQVGALVGLWAVLFVVLYLYIDDFANAVGFSIILTLIGSFFLRSLLPIPAPAETAPAPPTVSVEVAHPGLMGEVWQAAGWWLGLIIVLVCGWGAIAAVALATHQLAFVDLQMAATLAAPLSLGIFLLLERNFWLSRLMGLRITPGLPWWGSAVLLWAFGPVGLLLRSTAAKPQTSPDTRGKTQPTESLHITDNLREIVETVVFVVVLVLMLKSFVAEAFVIPTGSMAETLLGYQKMVTCPECGVKFPVNCSAEVDPSDERLQYVNGCTCPNCRLKINFVPPIRQDGTRVDAKTLPKGTILDPGWRSGDRVLVSKFVYDLPGKLPNRLDVVVFKFPGNASASEPFPSRSGPVKKHSPMNYIKRLIGLPGETIAIYRGKIYVLSPDKGLTYPDFDKAQGDPNELAQLWQFKNMHHEPATSPSDWKNRKGEATPALDRFFGKPGQFEIIRKPPAILLSMMRLVYDNDHPARDLGPEYDRWVTDKDSGWNSDGKRGFVHDGSGADLGFLHYHHLLCLDRGREQRLKDLQEELATRKQAGEDVADLQKQLNDLNREKEADLKRWPLITDFMGYNTWEPHPQPGENWVSDLIVECTVQVKGAKGVFALELSKGENRFQARFNLDDGTCKLLRLKGKETEELGSAETGMSKPGTYKLRFANTDDRLTVWVDGRLPFGDGVEYELENPHSLRPVKENDHQRPVSVGAWANVVVSGLKVYRDTYYTTAPSSGDVTGFVPNDPDAWKNIEDAPASTYYVQPGHFLCMGDNSPESSDGRNWGLVPKRLLLGRAVMVYYPFARAGRIR
jgi:signal peptidase I